MPNSALPQLAWRLACPFTFKVCTTDFGFLPACTSARGVSARAGPQGARGGAQMAFLAQRGTHAPQARRARAMRCARRVARGAGRVQQARTTCGLPFLPGAALAAPGFAFVSFLRCLMISSSDRSSGGAAPAANTSGAASIREEAGGCGFVPVQSSGSRARGNASRLQLCIEQKTCECIDAHCGYERDAQVHEDSLATKKRSTSVGVICGALRQARGIARRRRATRGRTTPTGRPRTSVM